MHAIVCRTHFASDCIQMVSTVSRASGFCFVVSSPRVFVLDARCDYLPSYRVMPLMLFICSLYLEIQTILMEILTLAKTSNFTFTFSFISYLTKAGSVIHTASVIGSWNHLQFRSSLLINGHTPLSLSRVILCCAEKKMMGWWYVLDDHDTGHYFCMRSHYQSQYFIVSP